MFTEHFDIDHRFVDVTELDRAEQTFDSVDDLQPSPVTERQNQRESVVARSGFDRFVQLFLATFGKISQPPDGLKANIFLDQLRRFLLQKLFQQAHQREDFAFWALPVLR